MALLPRRCAGGKGTISEFIHLIRIQADDIFALGVACSITLVMLGTGTVILTAGVRLSWTPRVCTLRRLTIPMVRISDYWSPTGSEGSETRVSCPPNGLDEGR
jgi:hypothetical protein